MHARHRSRFRGRNLPSTFAQEMASYGASDAWDFTTQTYIRGGVLAPSGITFTRASAKTALNAAGRIVPFASGKLAVTDLGALIEQGSTNVATTSQWATTSGSGNTIIPSGTGWSNFANTGTRSVGSSTVNSAAQAFTFSGTSQRSFIGFSFAAASSTTYTVSFWVEAISGTPGVVAYTSGTLGSGGTTGDVTNPSVGRVSYTFTTGTSAGTVDCRFGLGVSTTETGSITISNPQIEALSFPSSFIASGAAATARAADNVNVAYTLASPLTVYAEYQPLQTVSTAGVAVQWGISPTRVRVGRNISGGSVTGAELYVQDTADQAVLRHGAGTANANAIVRQAVRLATNDFASCVGGGTVLTDTSGTLPASLTTLYLGSELGSNTFQNGYLRRVALFPVALTNAQLQEITS